MIENKEEVTINYKPLGRYILLKTKDKTDAGLFLPSNIKQTTLALEVALVADGINHIKAGDMVVMDNVAVTAWTIDNKNYYQVHESAILGIVLNGATIESTVLDSFAPKDPTQHYNQ